MKRISPSNSAATIGLCVVLVVFAFEAVCAQQNDTTVENIVPEVIFVGVETTPDEMTTTELIESDAVKDFKPEPEWAGQTRKHGDSSNIIITEDGYCGWWNGNEYEKPTMNYSNPFGPEPVRDYDDIENFLFEAELQTRNCLFRFQTKTMTPVCGDKRFDLLKYCSMVSFFNNALPAPIKGGNADMLLVLIDGCVLCKRGVETEQPRVTITLQHVWPAGTFFTGCRREKNNAATVTVDLNTDQLFEDLIVNQRMGIKGYSAFHTSFSSSFFLSTVLYQRNCKGIVSSDEKHTEYEEVMLHMTHDCGGEQKTFIINLANINPAKFTNNVMELRSLMLLLDEDKPDWLQFSVGSQQFEEHDHPMYSNWDDAQRLA